MVGNGEFKERALEAIEQTSIKCNEEDRLKCDNARDAIKEMDVMQLLKEGGLYGLIRPLAKLISLSDVIEKVVSALDKELPQVQKNYNELTDDKANKLVYDGPYYWLDTFEGRKGPYCPKCFSSLKYNRDEGFALGCEFCGFLDKTKVVKQGQAEIIW